MPKINLPADPESFFAVPGNPHVKVARDGRAIRLPRGTLIAPYWTGRDATRRGTMTVRILTARGTEHGFSLQRLLALAFVPVPEELRHLCKHELEASLVEIDKPITAANVCWIKRGSQQVRTNLTRKDLKAVVSRHVKTGEITHYATMTEVARKLGCVLTVVERHLSSPEAGTLTADWCVYKFDNDSEWPKLESHQYFSNTWWRGKGKRTPMLVHDSSDNSQRHFCTIRSASEGLGINYARLSNDILKSNSMRYGRYQFTLL